MALVCPEDVAGQGTDTRKHFATYYENCMIVPFPADHRPFNEVIVFGKKRARPLLNHPSWQVTPRTVYSIPLGNGPKVFEKVQPTEPELERMLASSPLRTHLIAVPAA